MIFNRNNKMKRIIYVLTFISVLALCSCSGQYDNIDNYATEETVYVGKYTDMPYIRIGYQRVEIELLGLEVGRISPDNIYLGKAKRTVVEYEEGDVLFRQTIDSVCSWVNVTGLTTPKTYIFNIYAEDANGNRSVPVEVLGKPFTRADLDGLDFPLPYVIPSPSTLDFRWVDDSGLSSALFRFSGLIYSYTNGNGEFISDTLSARETLRFSITGLNIDEIVPITVRCRIIPMVNGKQIMDTVTMDRVFEVKTVSLEEYLAARTLRPIASALINPDDMSQGTITMGGVTDHLEWTEIRYVKSNGDTSEVRRIPNSNSEAIVCPDIKRGARIQVRCAFIPPQTYDECVTEWQDVVPFMVEFDRKDWVVIPKNGNHPWDDNVGNQDLWNGGHPMLILDDDIVGGWHSELSSPFPQVLIIDMKEPQSVAEVDIFARDSYTGGDGYWNHVSIYLTDNLSMPGYETHTVDWDAEKAQRQADYASWVNSMMALIPANLPAASWGAPVGRTQSAGDASLSFPLTPTKVGRYLIVMFPDNNMGWGTYINVKTLRVYGE
jgi:hypothetical protein